MTCVLLSKKIHQLYDGVEGADIIIKSTNKFLDLAKGEADIAIRNRIPTNAEVVFRDLNREELNSYSIYGHKGSFQEKLVEQVDQLNQYDWVIFPESKAQLKVDWLKKHIRPSSIRYRVHNASLVMEIVSSTPNSVAILPRFIGESLENVIEIFRPNENLSFKHYILRRKKTGTLGKKVVQNMLKIFCENS